MAQLLVSLIHPLVTIIVLLLGCSIIAIYFMFRTKSMITDKYGKSIGLTGFTTKKPTSLGKWLNRMPDRSIVLILKWLKLDYIFMLFFYPFLFSFLFWLTDYGNETDINLLIQLKNVLPLLVFIAAVMDILENLYAMRCINHRKKPGFISFAQLMRVFSYGKWLSLAAIIVFFIIYKLVN